MNQDNMFSNDYVYSLQQQSQANYERAVRYEGEVEELRDEIARLREFVAQAGLQR